MLGGLKADVTGQGYVQYVCVALGVTKLIYMYCNVRGGNVLASSVYLVLGYVHFNAAVFRSTEPTVKFEEGIYSVITN